MYRGLHGSRGERPYPPFSRNDELEFQDVQQVSFIFVHGNLHRSASIRFWDECCRDACHARM